VTVERNLTKQIPFPRPLGRRVYNASNCQHVGIELVVCAVALELRSSRRNSCDTQPLFDAVALLFLDDEPADKPRLVDGSSLGVTYGLDSHAAPTDERKD